MDSAVEQDREVGREAPLTVETQSSCHCEGEVVTCAHCGRPTSECNGECDHVLETRDWLIPSYSTATT
jgi:hypothetical protein